MNPTSFKLVRLRLKLSPVMFNKYRFRIKLIFELYLVVKELLAFESELAHYIR